MLTQNELLLKETREKRRELAEKAKSIIEKARDENRNRTQDEEAEVTQLHSTILNLEQDEKKYAEQVEVDKDILRSVGDEKSKPQGLEVKDPGSIRVNEVKSIGEQFTDSDGFKSMVAQMKGGAQSFGSGGVSVENKAGTLFEGGQGAGLIPVPQVIPGQVETLFQRLTVADLLPTGQASTNSIRYVVEGTATNSAAGVAEGAAKPASDVALSTKDISVTKIATSLTVSDEQVEDVPQVQSYVNGRLSLFVKIEEERQLLRGAGSGSNELQGIIGLSGVHTYGRGTVDNNAVALFKALNGTRGSSFLEPDAIIMHPDNWQTTRLLTDTAGQFFGGGPFQGPYGNGSNLSASGQVTGALDSIWNKPVVVTTAVGSGTALVGSFKQAAQFFRRGGLTVEASNGYQDYFLKNLVAIRAEERGALAVYRPGAFTTVTGLN